MAIAERVLGDFGDRGVAMKVWDAVLGVFLG